MMKPPRSCSPSTDSVAGATSRALDAAEALACAAAIVGAVINATEAVAAISPLKRTSASPFELKLIFLIFGLYLIAASEAVYPRKQPPG
ncbi:MAG TPA: hypothetical protein VF548_05350, partial [Allosphingosinicella sp.]|jgi:uncharacterized membrane protein